MVLQRVDETHRKLPNVAECDGRLQNKVLGVRCFEIQTLHAGRNERTRSSPRPQSSPSGRRLPSRASACRLAHVQKPAVCCALSYSRWTGICQHQDLQEVLYPLQLSLVITCKRPATHPHVHVPNKCISLGPQPCNLQYKMEDQEILCMEENESLIFG